MKQKGKELREFVRFLKQLQTEKQLQELLGALLTPKELDEIPKRLQIVKLLRQGVSQREIAQRLEVGIATVTRGARVKDSAVFSELDEL